MAATGGPIVRVNISGRDFPATGDSNGQRSLGGYNVEKQPNGDKSARTIMTPTVWYQNAVTIEIDDTRGDQEFIQNIVNDGVDVPISVTYTPGNVTYQGIGLPTGAIEFSNESASMQCNLSGPGEFTKQ